MFSILLIRSVPLSKQTRQAWKNAGGTFRRRGTNKIWLDSFKFDAVLNLGSLGEEWDRVPVPVYNMPESILAVSHPKALRRLLNDWLPDNSVSGSHWHKHGGFGGSGVVFHDTRTSECDGSNGDTQRHIVGDEYRIISVGNKIVQASRKHGSHSNFEWEWIGVEGVNKNGIIPFLKKAIEQVPNGGRTVFGWDVIHDGSQPYILECNTSPGVNEASALRIVNAIKEDMS